MSRNMIRTGNTGFRFLYHTIQVMAIVCCCSGDMMAQEAALNSSLSTYQENTKDTMIHNETTTIVSNVFESYETIKHMDIPNSVSRRHPSSTPTVLSNRAPSHASPTRHPIASIQKQWLQRLPVTPTFRLSNTGVYTVEYSELILKGETMHGGCSTWLAVLSGYIQPSNIQYKATGIRLSVVDTFPFRMETGTHSCTQQPNAVKQIVKFLSSAADSTSTKALTPLNVTCDNHRWIGRQCANDNNNISQLSLCVDCDDPCFHETHCASETNRSFSDPHAFSPCMTSARGSNTSTSVFRVFSVTFEEHEQPPTITDLNVIVARNSITADVTLDRPGSVACAVYGQYASNPSRNVEPNSHEQILLHNNVASTTDNNITTVVIGGLSALTNYKLYCMTVSASNTITPMSTVYAEARLVTTFCCKTATVSTTFGSVKPNKNAVNYIAVTLNAPPTHRIEIHLKVYKNTTNGNGKTLSVLVPSKFKIPKAMNKHNNQPVILTSSLLGLKPGDYYTEAALTGPGATEFEVEYATVTVNRLHFTVLSDTQPLPAPVLKSAVFAADGSHVKVSFDSATDRGGTATKFTCSDLFNFTCAAISRCQWVNNATVHAFVASESHCAAPDDQLSIQPSALIKAVCFSGSCDSGLSAVPTTVTIMAPDSALSPVVSISAPSTIGRCSFLTVDISGSTGSGGRPWEANKITVVASTAVANVAAIQRFLDTEYRISPPTAIPWQLLTSDVTYIFTASLCNFMGKCGQRQSRVTVLDSLLPTVTIAGPAMREVKANAPLMITADAYMTDCEGNRTTDGLTYLWSVLRHNVVLTPPAWQARNLSTLLFPAGSMSVGVHYTVSLTVTTASSQKSTISSVQVMMVPGDVVAVIAGGTSQTVTAGGVVRLDASGSYDEDTHGVTGVSAGLTFQWTCKQVEPILHAVCSKVFVKNPKALMNAYLFIASVRDSTATDIVGAVVDITVTVSDAQGLRSDTSTVMLTVLPSQ